MQNYSGFPVWVEQVEALSREKTGFVVRDGGPYRRLFEAGLDAGLAVTVMRRVRRAFIMRSLMWVLAWAGLLASIGLVVAGCVNFAQVGWPERFWSLAPLGLFGILISSTSVMLLERNLQKVREIESFVCDGEKPHTAKLST